MYHLCFAPRRRLQKSPGGFLHFSVRFVYRKRLRRCFFQRKGPVLYQKTPVLLVLGQFYALFPEEKSTIKCTFLQIQSLELPKKFSSENYKKNVENDLICTISCGKLKGQDGEDRLAKKYTLLQMQKSPERGGFCRFEHN